jgi:hypothetical protein
MGPSVPQKGKANSVWQCTSKDSASFSSVWISPFSDETHWTFYYETCIIYSFFLRFTVNNQQLHYCHSPTTQFHTLTEHKYVQSSTGL